MFYLYFFFSYYLSNYFLFFGLLTSLMGSILSLTQRKIKNIIVSSSIVNTGFLITSLYCCDFCFFDIIFIIINFFFIYGLNLFIFFFFINFFKIKTVRDWKFKNLNIGNLNYLSDLNNLNEFNFLILLPFIFCIFSLQGLPPFIGFLAKLPIYLHLLECKCYISFFLLSLSNLLLFVAYARMLWSMIFYNDLIYYSIKFNIIFLSYFFFSSFLIYILIYIPYQLLEKYFYIFYFIKNIESFYNFYEYYYNFFSFL